MDEITRICQDAVKTMMGFTLGPCGHQLRPTPDEAAQTAKTLCALFGLEYKAGNSSDFARASMVGVQQGPRPGRQRPHRHRHLQRGPGGVPPGPPGRAL